MKHKNFFIVPNQIFELGLKPKEFVVYCCLLRHSDKNNDNCFPSRRLIANECSMDKKTVDEERKRFRESNLSADNNGGAIIIDSKYETVTPIDSKPYIINSAQMSQIKENVFNYFGVNDDVLQNKFNSSGWNAFYEGKVETFALQMSLVHTNMTFNFHELAYGNEFIFTSNRMQYLEPSEKLSVVTQLFDRGMLTQNQGLEIFNLPPVQDGDRYFIRKEYIDTAEIQTSSDDNSNEIVRGENNAD